MVIDDDPIGSRMTTAVLSASGFLADGVADGREALARIEEFEPDAVLLDLMMPGRDGFELCRLIRVNPRIGRTSIIIVTGLLDLEARQRGIACGATDYLTKPWQPEDIVLRVRNAVELKRASDEIEYAYGEIERLRGRIAELESAADPRVALAN